MKSPSLSPRPQTDFERLSELDADVPNPNAASDAEISKLPRKRWSQRDALGRDDDATCSICFEVLENGDEYVPLPCDHCYHASCLATWLKVKKVCPVCKVDVFADDDKKPAAQT